MEDATNKSKHTTTLTWLGIGLVITSVILLIIFLLHGQVIVSGNFTNDKTEESILCERQNTGYFLFSDSRILGDSTKLTLFFEGTSLRLASLVYSATTGNSTTAQNVEAVMMSELNMNFGNEYGFNGLGANFASSGNTTRMSLTANISEIGTNGKKYFLIDNIPDHKNNYYEELTKRGFNCKRINTQDGKE